MNRASHSIGVVLRTRAIAAALVGVFSACGCEGNSDGAAGVAGSGGSPPDAGSPWHDVSPIRHDGDVDLRGVWGSSARDVWAVGGNGWGRGTILHWDGASWSPWDLPPSAGLRCVWGNSADDVWAGGDFGTLMHWDGTSWSTSNWHTQADGVAVTGLWGTGRNDVWAMSWAEIRHWDGATWVLSKAISGTASPLFGIWGSASDDVWVVGALRTTWHWDGSAWSDLTERAHPELFGVWGRRRGELWAFASEGKLLRWNGSDWSPGGGVPSDCGLPQPNRPCDIQAIHAMWGTSDDLWAVGSSGVILHSAGNDEWAMSRSGTLEILNGIWGSGPSDIWAVGASGTLLHLGD